MLRRAKRLQAIFNPFCEEYNRGNLALNAEEQRQINYLLQITQLFFNFTLKLSKTKDTTTHYIFKIYNKLFDHLKQSKTQLERKRMPQKKTMYRALDAAFIKLRDYYRETNNIRGDLYIIRAMLAPANKFHFFSTDDWDDKWRKRYRRNFKEYLSLYQERLVSR